MTDYPGVENLYEQLGYTFRDPRLLLIALTHTSYANEHPQDAPQHNERMEFLGDAVLDFIVSDALMDRFPDLPEGDLSKIRASLVSEAALADIARKLELGAHLRIGRGEYRSGGQDKDSILSDALEALFAAIYRDSMADSGIAEVRRVILALFDDRFQGAASSPQREDYKTTLQELVQGRGLETVRYTILAAEGPDHDKEFMAAVILNGRELARGSGRSKKIAEQEAARAALRDTQWLEEAKAHDGR